MVTALLFAVTVAAAQRPIGSGEALATAHRIEAATNRGDAGALDRFLDLDSLIDRMRQKSHALKDPAFFRGFSESFTTNFGHYGQRILPSIKLGNYRLLREYESKGSRHLLFRMFGAGGLNYHDYTLIRVKDSIKAADVYVYSIDESMSGSIATLADMMNNSAEKLPEDVSMMIKLTDENNKKNYAGVKEQYEQLDEKYKKTKAMQLVYISACHHLDQALYEGALEHFAASFPDAPSGYLMLIDLYYLRKEYDKGFTALDKMDKLLGGDPALDIFRGNFYRLQGKKAESLACYERVFRYDPGIAANARFLIVAYEEAGDKAKAKTVITEFRKTGAYHEADLSDLFTKYPELK